MKKIVIALLVGTLFLTVALAPISVAAPSPGTGSTSGLTSVEVNVLNSLDYDNAWNYLAYLSSLGEKVSGTVAERNAQQWVYNTMLSFGMDKVVLEEFPVSSWIHKGTTVKIASNGYEEIQATTYGDSYSIWGYENHVLYAFGNANDGKTLIAPVVDIGKGTAAEFNAIGDLNGAIALAHRDDNIQGWPNVISIEAAQHGASAAVFYGYYAGNDLPAGIKQDSVGGPIPAISISPMSAMHIQELMSSGIVTLQIDGRADKLSDKFAKSVNVAGYIYGSVRPDEYVVVSGHIDCWWNGSSDDSSSIAAMLELARLYASSKDQFRPERTMVFCSVGAEEEGGPKGTWYNWLVGSYEFVMAHPEIMEGLVVELNMDGVSFVKTSGKYWSENTWEVNGFISKAISDLGMNGAIGYYNPVWSWTDAWSFAAKGGGSAIQMTWVAGYDPYYHTQYDDMPMQSIDHISTVLKLYTLLGMRAVNAFVVPIEFQYTCDWAMASLKSEKMTVAPEAKNIESAMAVLSALRSQAVATNSYAASLKAQYDAASTQAAKDAVWTKADALNQAIIDARRIITPWTLGEGGLMGSWDVFLRTDQHAHDYGFVNSAILALSRGQIGNAVTALGSVYTMEWGKYFSRETYLNLLDSMVNTYMYWGDDFDQQQMYVDVQGIYLGLKDGSISKSTALVELKSIRDNQLIPWFEEDLDSLKWAWGEATGILDAAVP